MGSGQFSPRQFSPGTIFPGIYLFKYSRKNFPFKFLSNLVNIYKQIKSRKKCLLEKLSVGRIVSGKNCHREKLCRERTVRAEFVISSLKTYDLAESEKGS